MARFTGGKWGIPPGEEKKLLVLLILKLLWKFSRLNLLTETSGADRARRAEHESVLSFVVLGFYTDFGGFEIF